MIFRVPDINLAIAQKVRRQFLQEGFTATLERKHPTRVYEHLLDGSSWRMHLRWLAVSLPKDGRTGACGCSPMNWCGWMWWKPSPMRRYARCFLVHTLRAKRTKSGTFGTSVLLQPVEYWQQRLQS